MVLYIRYNILHIYIFLSKDIKGRAVFFNVSRRIKLSEFMEDAKQNKGAGVVRKKENIENLGIQDDLKCRYRQIHTDDS